MHTIDPQTAPSATRSQRADAWLTAATADLLAHHDRLRGLDVQVRFDGGVAHVTGSVAGHDDVRAVHELVGRLAGVHGVWDRLRVGGRDPVILDVGCGDTVQYPGNVGLDRRPGKAVSIVADAARGLPLADASVDRVFTVHVLEHLHDFLPLLTECHRVLRPGGMLHVLAPWWRHVNAVADPTHVRFIDVQTIKGVCLQAPEDRRWYPQHVSCDGATVFADLLPLRDGDPGADEDRLARFFD